VQKYASRVVSKDTLTRLRDENQNCGSIPNRLHDILFVIAFIQILRPSATPVERVSEAQFSRVKRSDFVTYPTSFHIRPNIEKG
jgi:hypothetical protein